MFCDTLVAVGGYEQQCRVEICVFGSRGWLARTPRQTPSFSHKQAISICCTAADRTDWGRCCVGSWGPRVMHEGGPPERLRLTPRFRVQHAPLPVLSSFCHRLASCMQAARQQCCFDEPATASLHWLFVPAATDAVSAAAAADVTGLRRSLRTPTPTCCPWCWATVRRYQSPRGSWQSGRGRCVS